MRALCQWSKSSGSAWMEGVGFWEHRGLRAKVRPQSSCESLVSSLRRRERPRGAWEWGWAGPQPPIFHHVAWEEGPLGCGVLCMELALPEAVLWSRATDSQQE